MSRFFQGPLPKVTGLPDSKRAQLERQRKMTMSQRREFWARNAEEQYRRAGRDPAEMHHSCAKVLVGPHDADSWDEMIEKDVPRTGVHPVFQTAKGQVPLRNVLRAFCRLRPETGYCQAQSMITAQLLRVYVYNEDAVLGLLLCLSDVILPEYFSDNMRGLIGDLEIFHVFMHDRLPNLYEHIRSLADQDDSPPLVNAFVSAWQASLFLHALPANKVILLWDCLFLDGGEILIRTALAMFALLETDLMNVHGSLPFYGTMQEVNRQLSRSDDPLFPNSLLLEIAYSLAPFPLPCYEFVRQRRRDSPTHMISDLGILKSQVDMTLRSSSQDAEACLTNKTSAGGAGHTAAASIVAQDAYLDEGEWDDLVILPDRRPYAPPEVYIPPDADVSDPGAIWELINTDEANDAEYGFDAEALAEQESMYEWFVNAANLTLIGGDHEKPLRVLCRDFSRDLLEKCLRRYERWEVSDAEPKEQVLLMIYIMRTERISFLVDLQQQQYGADKFGGGSSINGSPKPRPIELLERLGKRIESRFARAKSPAPAPSPSPSPQPPSRASLTQSIAAVLKTK